MCVAARGGARDGGRWRRRRTRAAVRGGGRCTLWRAEERVAEGGGCRRVGGVARSLSDLDKGEEKRKAKITLRVQFT